MALPRYIPRYTVQDFQAWEGSWELWSGIAVAMSPSADAVHQMAAGRLFRRIGDALERDGCANCQVYYELDWIVDSETVLRPDILVLCGYKPEKFVEKTPVLIAEVLSDSTRQRDLLYKREIYQQLGVRFYLIADPKTKATQVLVNGPDGFGEGPSELILDQDCSLLLSFDDLYE